MPNILWIDDRSSWVNNFEYFERKTLGSDWINELGVLMIVVWPIDACERNEWASFRGKVTKISCAFLEWWTWSNASVAFLLLYFWYWNNSWKYLEVYIAYKRIVQSNLQDRDSPRVKVCELCKIIFIIPYNETDFLISLCIIANLFSSRN